MSELKFFYGRTSSADQTIHRQVKKANDLDIAPARTFIDQGYSGSNYNRPRYERMIEKLQEAQLDGFQPVVHFSDITRLGRNLTATLVEAQRLKDLGVVMIFEHENLTLDPRKTDVASTTTFHLLATFAETSRMYIKEAQRDGIQNALEHDAKQTDPAKKKYKGRAKQVDRDLVGALYAGGFSKSKIAEQVGCSRMTVHRILDELGMDEEPESEHAPAPTPENGMG